MAVSVKKEEAEERKKIWNLMANTYRSQQERSERAHSSTVHIVLRTALSLSLETQNLEPMTFDCLACNLVLGTISVIRNNILLSPYKNTFFQFYFHPLY